jgi:uncharacterized protein (UPF0333 family)
VFKSEKEFKMSTGLKIGIILGTLFFVLMFGVVGSYISYANYGARTEATLEAKLENNENIYANGTQKIIEMAQVPSMYVDAVSRVTKDAISGRYGQDGSKAVFQMLKEQNPNIESGMFVKIQQTIEAFRNEFQNNQTAMIDMKRSYKTQLNLVWSGFWLHIAGYPKNDLSKFDIVTTDKARTTFSPKRDSSIQLNHNH